MCRSQLASWFLRERIQGGRVQMLHSCWKSHEVLAAFLTENNQFAIGDAKKCVLLDTKEKDIPRELLSLLKVLHERVAGTGDVQ